MKIVAAPMPLPAKHDLTKENLAKSSIGKKTVALINEGINKKILAYKSVDDYLQKFQSQMLIGTCYGQASAAIIAAHHTQDMSGKALVEQASMVDTVSYQILSNLNALLNESVWIKKRSKKIHAKLENAGKNEAKKLKREKKAIADSIQSGARLGFLIKKPETRAIPHVQHFREKVCRVAQSALEKQSGYRQSSKAYITSHKKHKFIKCIKELQKEESDVALRVIFRAGNSLAHAVALFPAHRLVLYDSNFGAIQASSKKEFVKEAKELYDTYFHHSKGSIEMEVFKGKQ